LAAPEQRRSARSVTDRTVDARPSPTRAAVFVPLRTRRVEEGERTAEARLAEAVGLALAVDLEVVASGIVPLSAVRPATFLGKGKVEELAGIIRTEEVGLVLIDSALTPVQQRNLERAWNAKVLDRTGLILEIFGRRARTREGSLQVELAHLTWQKSRLVRSWTHLERQRGGFGFLGGPGETQIEADRRVIQDRILRIKKELDQVKRTRGLHRESRKRVPFPVVALVGYTNAGKSTLFNRLTRASVQAEDMLFATLDPTLRALDLPEGTKAILSDTVGFISELPTLLVAAFRATLEEVIEAELILHVRDVAREDSEAQAEDVYGVLKDLGIDPAADPRLLEVWNKIDLLDSQARAALANVASRRTPAPLLVSAETGEGISDLLAAIEARVAEGRPTVVVEVDSSDGGGLHWLYEAGEVLAREDLEGRVRITLRIDESRRAALQRRFPGATVAG
jgi:GTP-binding protein HflX